MMPSNSHFVVLRDAGFREDSDSILFARVVMPVSEKTAIPSCSLELDPLLRGLVDKKLSLKMKVTSMATELKGARKNLASRELLFAQESETRKVAELKARNLEEVRKLQKCLEDKDELLRSSLCRIEQYRNELDSLRSQLCVTQATVEATAVSAKSALLHCSSLLGKLNDKDKSLSEHGPLMNNLGKHLDHPHEYPKNRDSSRMQLKGYSLRTESDIRDAFAKSGFDNVNELLKILSDVSPDSENIDKDLIFEDDSIAKLRVGIMVLSANWKNKSKQLESQLYKHRRTVQELKRKVLKLEFGLQEPRSRLRKLQRIREKWDKALKELRSQVAVEQLCGTGSGDKHSLWESSAFKLVASMSMLALVTLVKR